MALPSSREKAVIDETAQGVESLFAPTISAICRIAHDGVLLEGSPEPEAKAADEKIRTALRSLIETAVMNGMHAQQELERQRRRDQG